MEAVDEHHMLDAWKSVRQEFTITNGHGRLKNNLTTTKRKPPDMLINVLFDGGGYTIVAEIQIHLRSIHRLKQEQHFLYEVARADGVHALRHASAPAPAPAPAPSPAFALGIGPPPPPVQLTSDMSSTSSMSAVTVLAGVGVGAGAGAAGGVGDGGTGGGVGDSQPDLKQRATQQAAKSANELELELSEMRARMELMEAELAELRGK